MKKLFVFLLFFLNGCTSIFYYPRVQKFKFVDPDRVNLQHEEVEIVVNTIEKRPLRIHAWWLPATKKSSNGTVIFFHGNAQNLTAHFLNLAWLPEQGYNYLIWDYPGYGVSEGEPSPRNNLLAAHEVLRWVKKNKEKRPLIILGQSLGGNIALRTALDLKEEVALKTVVLDGSFLSYRSVARQKASESWITWLLQPLAWLLMSDQYAPSDPSELSPIPLLVIAGMKDRVVPPHNSEKIFALAKEPKQFWRIEEGVHTDTFSRHDKLYQRKFIEYLKSLE